MKRFPTIATLAVGLLTFVQASAQGLPDDQLLKLYDGLRVSDVSDGMDMVGLRDTGILGQEIEALWKDIDDMSHIVRGLAVTARYVPTNKIIPNPMTPEDFVKMEADGYATFTNEPYVDFIKPGTVVVLDVGGDGDTGSVGSLNGLYWVSKGAVGIVSNGGIRDTDEVIKERIPVYMDHANRGRGIRPGRNEIESFNRTVSVGGVQINPGDVIVADGDGVICVPREHAEQVALYARNILDDDKAKRRNLYDELGMEHDLTVSP